MLNELIATITTLRSRIEKSRDFLEGHETRTRMALIDPLLQALGWDTADPAQVRPEFTNGGRADYALFSEDQRPIAIIEAKKLNTPLGNAELQMLTYAVASNVDNAVLTDGDQWLMYRTFERQQDKRLVLNISIANTPKYQCALKLLLLWRPNLESDQPIEASEPLLVPEPPPPPRPTPPIPPTPPPPPPTAQGWKSLADYKHAANAKPARLRLPDGEEKPMNQWTDLLLEVAKWLKDSGQLTPERYPVRVGKHEVIYQGKKHDFQAWQNQIDFSDNFYVMTNGSAEDKVRRCKGILKALSISLATVHVQVN